jgi:hypothetical protein
VSSLVVRMLHTKKSEYSHLDLLSSSLWLITQGSFDADPPIECDDEYWENPDPEKAFKQPNGVPCSVTTSRLAFELVQIASVLQTSMVQHRMPLIIHIY